MSDEKSKPAEKSKPTNELTEGERGRVDKWFRETVGGKAVCPVCQSKTWAIAKHFVAPLTGTDRRPDEFPVGLSPLYPYFLLVCRTCGNTQFINAVATGVMESKKEEPQ